MTVTNFKSVHPTLSYFYNKHKQHTQRRTCGLTLSFEFLSSPLPTQCLYTLLSLKALHLPLLSNTHLPLCPSLSVAQPVEGLHAGLSGPQGVPRSFHSTGRLHPAQCIVSFWHLKAGVFNACVSIAHITVL